LVIENIQAGQLVHRDAIIKNGVGLATKHFYGVSKIDQGFGEVSGVDTLASHMGFTAIGQVCKT
jgi:uncharacterized alkaline shock family protein YloU